MLYDEIVIKCTLTIVRIIYVHNFYSILFSSYSTLLSQVCWNVFCCKEFLRGYVGFETFKNRAFHNFLCNSKTCQEYFLKVSSIAVKFGSLWDAFCFKRFFLKIVFLTSVGKISNELRSKFGKTKCRTTNNSEFLNYEY